MSERRKAKLERSVSALVGDDETFVVAATAQQGPKTWHLALLSLFLSPIIAAIAWIFFQKDFVVLGTDRQTRVYRSSSMRPGLPVRLVSSGLAMTGGHPSLSAGTESFRNGGQSYRIESNATIVRGHSGSNASNRPTNDRNDSQQDSLPANHDQVLADNRRSSLITSALTPVAIIGLFAGIVGAVMWLDTPNAFSVSYQTSEEWCLDGNYGKYMAADTDDGLVMVLGLSGSSGNGIDNVYRYSKRDETYASLVTSRGKRKDGVGVVCVQQLETQYELASRCSSGGDDVVFRATRWDADESIVRAKADLTADELSCHVNGGSYEAGPALEQLLCDLDACLTSS